MITLYQPPPAWNLPSISPFCVKLETYLRMAQIEYKTAPGNMLQAPNGRVPYVDIDGARMGDSTRIIQHLKTRFGDPLDAALTREQRAQGLLLQRMVEDHLYFAAVWLRWSDEESWSYVRDYFIKLMPPLVGGLILQLVRRGMLKDMRTQGMGQHDREQIIEFAKSDLTALSDLLGDKPFFLGDAPSSVDATLYGFLIQMLWVPWKGPLTSHVATLGNLQKYCERMKARYWG